MIRITPHPEWIDDLLAYIKPYQQTIVESRIFQTVRKDRLTKRIAQTAMTGFYPLIESFPQFLALNLAKVPAGNGQLNNSTRDWLISNISQERQHASWWRHMAGSFGVSAEALSGNNRPPAQMDAINNYLHARLVAGSDSRCKLRC